MLLLSRKLHEEIVIDGDIVIEVVELGAGQIKLGITAPPGIRVLRRELVGRAAKARTSPSVAPLAGADSTGSPPAREVTLGPA